MKIIDKYLLKSFLITFTTVFVILFFIFVLQSIWLFIAELAGKDLDFGTIFKFIFYYSPIMVPLVLPLSILLASIMTFGSFAENYEFAAMKSGGISLRRAMKFLIVCTSVFSLIAFLFANNIIPEAQYRFVNLRKNILQTKPAMAIGEGQFNKIGTTTTIKVEKKSGENGEFLEGITMHMKKGEFGPVTTVIKAKNGVLKSDESTNLLQLDLLDGNYYEDIQSQKIEERDKLPFAKSSFKKYTINIDLARLNGSSEEGGEIINAFNMLSMNELKYTIDSLDSNYKKDIVSFSENIDKDSQNLSNVLEGTTSQSPVVLKSNIENKENLLELFPNDKKLILLEVAKSNISNTLFTIDNYKNDLEMKKKYINDFWIAYYDKILVAYSCLLMFFIGAPLGAIIRKGGLGLPIVFAVLIFIIFNFANTFGKKLAGQDAIHPFLGVAAGAIILTPFAILFTYRATNDMGLTIDLDWLIHPINKLFKIKNSNDFKFNQSIISLKNISLDSNDEDVIKLNSFNEESLISVVKNYKQFSYSNEFRIKALKILEQKGISQEQLLESNNLYNLKYLKLVSYSDLYKKQTLLALIFNLLSYTVIINLTNLLVLIFGFISVILMYYFLNKSSESLNEIKRITKREDSFVPTFIAYFFGLVLFIFIFSYNRYRLKEVISEFNN